MIGFNAVMGCMKKVYGLCKCLVARIKKLGKQGRQKYGRPASGAVENNYFYAGKLMGMKEIKAVIDAFELATQAGRQCALATVVHVEGSSYRSPGARMLVDDTGQLTGAISGGCLEGDALTKAMLVLARQKAKLVTYDTNDEDDAKLGVGLGCNGIIQVLIEPIIAAEANNPIALLKATTSTRQSAVLVTLYNLSRKNDEQPGTCLLLTQAGQVTSKTKTDTPLDAVVADAKHALSNHATHFTTYHAGQQVLSAFIEYIPPPISLVVVGAGNDVIPLVSMAALLGWPTTVVDGRHTHAKAERFVNGCQVLVTNPAQAFGQITVDAQTAVVLMTHNYHYDLAVLRTLATTTAAYIGMLGPKKKLDRALYELATEGVDVDGSLVNRLYGPTGLHIGAETPEEIALSILAEIKAVFSGCAGGPLRDHNKPIHVRQKPTPNT